MIVGITGTRYDISEKQYKLLLDYLSDGEIKVVQHGACTGADTEAHKIAVDLEKTIVVHPPIDHQYYSAEVDADKGKENIMFMPEQDFLVRNRKIVDTSDILVALPALSERPRSGTMYTVRYARRKLKPILLFRATGEVDTEGSQKFDG